MLNIKRILNLGRKVILVEFDTEIKPESLHQLLNIKAVLAKEYHHKNVEVTNTYASLCIHFLKQHKIDLIAEKEYIKSIISSIDLSEISSAISSKLHVLPVCYADEFAHDLDFLASELKLSKQQIIDLHTEPKYTIYFHGFLPGFLYLGGLAEALQYPRKKTPRLQIPKGSVGIGGKQTGIYPSESPGGWQLIGNCPLDLFDVHQNPPTPFQAGDQIHFEAISKNKHQEIKQQVKEGKYQHQIQTHD